MRPFVYERVDSAESALSAFATAPSDADRQYLAGGTTLVDLMKLDVMRPQAVFDINVLDRTVAGRIDAGAGGLRLGAMTRMAQAAEHPAVARDYPVIAHSLKLAASQQLRNMASLGGNVLQRTRCTYFRDVRTRRATSAPAAPAVRRSTASTACTPYSASATSASPRIPAISRRH